jgi:hypothetical protein
VKIIVLIAVAALGIFLVARLQKPAPKTLVVVPAPSTTATAVPPLAPTPSALRRPIARTQEVLGQVEKRNGAGEF